MAVEAYEYRHVYSGLLRVPPVLRLSHKTLLHPDSDAAATTIIPIFEVSCVGSKLRQERVQAGKIPWKVRMQSDHRD